MTTPRTSLTLKTGELFSGVGGLSLGFALAEHESVRFDPVFAVEMDRDAIEGYSHNLLWLHKHAPALLPQLEVPIAFQEDIEKIDVPALLRAKSLDSGELDLLIGGPPCQGFSTSNRRAKKDKKNDRNRLIKVFLDRVGDITPKMFLLENVQGVRWTAPTNDMVTMSNQNVLFPEVMQEPSSVREYVARRADALGYYLWESYLDAVEFGVPQHRMRYFAFGIRKDLASCKEDANLQPYLRKLFKENWVTVEEAIADLPALENGEYWKGLAYTPGDSKYVQKMRQFMTSDSLLHHVATSHTDIVIERYELIPEGGNWKDAREHMEKTYSTIENTHSNIYRRLRRNSPAHTISHYRKSMVIHPIQNRGLSFREACRLQSFPDWFEFFGESDHRQQQLANAVPPLMAAGVAWAIGECWSKIIANNSTAQEARLEAVLI